MRVRAFWDRVKRVVPTKRVSIRFCNPRQFETSFVRSRLYATHTIRDDPKRRGGDSSDDTELSSLMCSVFASLFSICFDIFSTHTKKRNCKSTEEGNMTMMISYRIVERVALLLLSVCVCVGSYFPCRSKSNSKEETYSSTAIEA